MWWKCRDGSSEWFNIHVLYSSLTGVSSRAVSWGRMSVFNCCEALWLVDLGQSARVFPRNLVGWSWMLVVLPEERGKVALGTILLPSKAREIHFDGFRWRSRHLQRASMRPRADLCSSRLVYIRDRSSQYALALWGRVVKNLVSWSFALTFGTFAVGGVLSLDRKCLELPVARCHCTVRKSTVSVLPLV